ncbi:MAG: hypothetical protein QM692_12205 [Thermomicrobiales bacterium]
MDAKAFDARTRVLGKSCNRRSLTYAVSLGAVAAAVALPLAALPATARRRRVKGEHNVRGHKAIMCIDGKTKRVAKKKRKHWLKQGATRGACSKACTPVCSPGICGDDGCGGTCACATGSVCISGACQVCDVACTSGDSVACGESLQAAIAAGGTVLVCPGEYQGAFTTPLDVEVIGAGSGDNPATSTILRGATAPGATVAITTAVTARIASLRVTGGSGSGQNSGGVHVMNAGANVTLENAALVKNTGYYGGGMSLYTGTLTVKGCDISENTATANGGGIATATLFTVESTTFSKNTAADNGGGIFVNSGTTNLGSGVTVTGNTGSNGGGIYKLTNGSTINGSATVTGNTPNNCAGAIGVTYTC